MFEMTVEDVFVMYVHTTVSVKCKNRKNFTSELVDENGMEYSAAIPFIKHVIPPEIDYITLELKGELSPDSLEGRTLRSLPQ